jgi:hypothetical protein
MTLRSRRWLSLALAPLVVAVTLTALPTAPAQADPDTPAATATGPGDGPDEKGDDELSGNATLNDVLESTNRKYVQAKSEVARSTAEQRKLATAVQEAEAKRDLLVPAVQAIAARQFETGRLTTAGYLLGATSSDDFLDKAMSLQEVSTEQDRKLAELDAAIADVNGKKAALDAEVQSQKNNLLAMQKQKEAADKALALLGGKNLTQGFVLAKSPVAAPAPRNAQGGFSPEPCNQPDPTTNGCITARTLHLYKEVKKAGFNRFVGCHRDGGPYEHPKGRACDWSLLKSGFAEAHNADMKNYGNNLMAFLVRNADRLGIYYVIWYAQIWWPATGWHTYHGPSNHKDHVHVSLL